MAHRAVLTEPKDLAWLLVSYARDAQHRVEAAGDAPLLHAVQAVLEEAFGIRFDGECGARVFRSTLVQTLFYGVFSAWVLRARFDGASGPPGNAGVSPASFNWCEAVWHLRAPMPRALFQQISGPGRLQPLGLVEVLDWTAAALDRVDRALRDDPGITDGLRAGVRFRDHIGAVRRGASPSRLDPAVAGGLAHRRPYTLSSRERMWKTELLSDGPISL